MVFTELKETFIKFQNLLSTASGSVLITSHQQADPDAIGAMIGVATLISLLKKDVNCLLVLDDVSMISQKIISYLEISILSINSVKFSDVSLIILVDSNNLEICPVAAKVLEERRDVSFVVIDHHEYSHEMATIADVYMISRSAGSTSEIIGTLLWHLQVEIDEKTALALICGILYDSGFLTRASAHLFRVIGYLCEVSPQVYSTSRNLLNLQMELSEKIARIKAAQRMRRRMLGDLILIFTHVSSHEASAARAILSLGADLVVVVASRKDETRVSIRASSYFMDKTGINLARDLLPWLLKRLEGNGGGHSKAAGLNLAAGISLNLIMERILEFLESKLNVGEEISDGED